MNDEIISNYELVYQLKLIKAKVINSLSMEEMKILELAERRLLHAEY